MPHPAHRVKPTFNSFPASKPLQLKQVSMSSKGSPNIRSPTGTTAPRYHLVRPAAELHSCPVNISTVEWARASPWPRCYLLLGSWGALVTRPQHWYLWSLFRDSRNSRHKFETWLWILAKPIAFSSIQEIMSYLQFPWDPDMHMKILSCPDAHKHPSTKRHQICAEHFVDK